MFHFPIGYIGNGTQLSTDALDFAVKLGLDGIQLYVARERVCPEYTDEQIAQFRLELAKRNLKLSALCGDIGNYEDAEVNVTRVPEYKRILDLAKKLGAPVVSTHIGKVPADSSDPKYAVMQAALREIGEYSAKIGVMTAIETGPEKARILRTFIDSLGTPGIGVNLDPANLTMCSCDDAVAAVYILAKYIVHTHAKDGVNLTPPTADAPRGTYLEKALGEGAVDFDAYLKALEDIGYRGFLTIEREIKEPEHDIAMAADFLREKMK